MTDFYLKQLWKLFEFGEKVFRYDEDGMFILISVDDHFCRMLGFGRNELMMHCHNRAKDLVYPPDLPAFHEHVIKELEEKGEYTARYRMRRRDGELIWVWESGVMEYDMSGICHVRNLVVNISDFENVRKERDITYDNLPGGVLRMLITKNNFYIMQFNQRYIDMIGASPEEYLGSSGLYTFPEDITQLKDHVTLRAEKRESIDHEFRCRRGDADEVHWFRLIGRFYDEVDDGSEYLCIMIDITARKQNALLLEKERNRYQMAMRLTSGVLFEYDAKNQKFHVYNDIADSEYIPCIEDGQFEELNEALFQEDFVHPEDASRFLSYVENESEYGVEVRLRAKKRDSSTADYCWFEISMEKTWRNGRLRYAVGSIKHIEEKEKDESVRWKLRNIFEAQSGKMYEKIICIDTVTEKVCAYISEQSKFRQYIPECLYDQYMGKTAENEIHPDERERFQVLMRLCNMQKILQPGQQEEVLFFRVRYNKREEYRYKCVRYGYLGDDIHTILISVQDVHQIREEQLKMEEANRKILASALDEGQVTLEMRRNFAAMIARELYAPLEFVDYELRRKWRKHEQADDIREAVSYMRRVVRNIALFERLEQGQIRFENKLFELDDVLWDVFQNWKNKLRDSGIRLTCRLNLKWKYYYGDSPHLARCIDHILGNCVLAADEKGIIDIWGSDEDQGNGISHLCLVVEDTGIPVNENFFGRNYPIEHLEDASAWKTGKNHIGSSYSLVVARKIIELLGGTIHLNRKTDRRNIIEITIPLQHSQKQKEKAQLLGTENEMVRGVDLSKYSLLVVGSTQRTSAQIKLSGAQVHMANGGKEGIHLWTDYSPQYFDAVLVEAELPDMDYLEFTEIFRRQNVGDCRTIPILAMADGIGQEDIREGIRRGVNAVLEKEPDLNQLKHILTALGKYHKNV